MKQIRISILAVCTALSLAACGRQQQTPQTDAQTETEQEVTELTLWTYPVGDWGNKSVVSNLISEFHRQYPEYHVSVEYLDYVSGDEKVAQAAADGTLPDLVFEGPERLVADWGDKGMMADLSDLWESESAGKIYEPVRDACQYRGGEYYEFPLCMTTHCMVINRDLFEKAGALSYIDEENRTWTTDDFVSAVEALTAYGQKEVGIVYCAGQGGDQGTRALVTNLCEGAFADEEHTKYVFDSPENIEALQLLKDLDGISFDESALGADEITRFAKGELAMAFCWNVSVEIGQTVNNPNLDFDMFPMAFPSDDGKPTLQAGIWGFGIFDNKDEAKIKAAKDFIRFFTEEDKNYARAVLASTYWPVREMPELYANDVLMKEYSVFTQYLGDYYQVTPGWADARTAWWNMLQEIGDGADIPQTVKKFNDTANAAAQAAEGESEPNTAQASESESEANTA